MEKKLKVSSKEDIINLLNQHREEIKKYKVKRIGLFGSFIRGEQTAKSDIDFFVEFEEPIFDDFIGLSNFLEGLFKRRVEILTPAGLESIRIEHIKEEIKRSIYYV
ncbi:MAG: nucleotidyltransferase family protein [Candidatus Omnitrophica bacterium]|nr:nucleotidyltransferase family protein [Candidatus Omnitrophota bacterium]